MIASFYSGKIEVGVGDPTLEEICRYATQDHLCQLCVDKKHPKVADKSNTESTSSSEPVLTLMAPTKAPTSRFEPPEKFPEEAVPGMRAPLSVGLSKFNTTRLTDTINH